MVTITNGTNVYTVTRGAFESIYSKQGFKIYEPSKKAEYVDEKLEEFEELTDDEFVEKLEEKPLSEWNKTEVKRYAEIFGIDIYGTKNIAEARDLIREFKADDEELEVE